MKNENSQKGLGFLEGIRNKAGKLGKTVALAGALAVATEARAEEAADPTPVKNPEASQSKEKASPELLTANFQSFLTGTLEPFLKEMEEAEDVEDHAGLDSDDYALGREQASLEKDSSTSEEAKKVDDKKLLEELESSIAYHRKVINTALRYGNVLTENLSLREKNETESDDRAVKAVGGIFRVEGIFQSRLQKMEKKRDALLVKQQDELVEKKKEELQKEFENLH